MKIRVLQLESWMRYIDDPDRAHTLPILQPYKPPYGFPSGRPGYYCATFSRYHTDCWIQVHGKAFRYPTQYFMYSLAIMSAAERNVPTSCDGSRLSWEKKEAARLAIEAKSIRDTSRGFRLRLIRGYGDR